MNNRMATRQVVNSNRQSHTLVTSGPGRNSQGIPALILLFLFFLAGCGSTSPPLYYKANSSMPPQPQMQPQMYTQMQPVQMQPQPQIKAQPRPQMQDPMQVPPQMQSPASSEGLQPRLMMQAAQSGSSRYKDYKVGPEDLLVVDVLGQKDLQRELRVNGQGQISMPLVGVVSVGGLTTHEIEERLMKAYGSEYLRNPQVTVEVKEFHHQRVAVTGAVMKPGFYDIIGPRSLLEVLAMAGGLGNKPGPEAGDVVHVILRQSYADAANSSKAVSARAYSPQPKIQVINIQRLVSGTDPELNVMIKNGDVVYVPFAGTAYVTGGVRKPGNVVVKDNLTLTQAVAMAQGVDPTLGTNKVVIMRFDQQGRPLKIEGDLKDITVGKEADIPVKDNDTIVVVEGEVKKKLWVIRQLLPIPSGGYSIPTQ